MVNRRASNPPPDRLAAVLGEVDRARRGGWVPDESDLTDRPRRRPASTTRELGRAQGSGRGQESSTRPTIDRARHLRSAQDTAIRPHSPLVRTPASLQDAQLGPSRLALVAVLVLVVAAGVVLGGRMLWVRAMAQPQPVRTLPPATSGGGRPDALMSRTATSPGTRPTGATAGAPAATAAPTQLMVHVVGQVRRPGVVRLASGARVQDAVNAAGGATAKADLARVNLARPVVDGEQVVVPKPGEPVTNPDAGGSSATTGGAAAGPAGGSSAAAGPVNLNTADANALDALPGVGPVIAQRIVQWRTENGRFSSVDELSEVSGIGDKLMEQLRPLVSV